MAEIYLAIFLFALIFIYIFFMVKFITRDDRKKKETSSFLYSYYTLPMSTAEFKYLVKKNKKKRKKDGNRSK